MISIIIAINAFENLHHRKPNEIIISRTLANSIKFQNTSQMNFDLQRKVFSIRGIPVRVLSNIQPACCHVVLR